MKVREAILLIVMCLMVNLVDVMAYNCLPKRLKKLEKSPKHQVLTVKGDTYNQAAIELRNQMPQMGFLQKIKVERTQLLTNKSYKERLKLSKSLKANVGAWLRYNCKHQGEYYITALYAKEDVKYVDFWYPRDFNLKEIKRVCGSKKIVLLMAKSNQDFSYVADDAYQADFQKDEMEYSCKKNGYRAHRYCHWKILCGTVKMKLGNSKLVVANDFEQFMAIGVSKGALGYSYDDLTTDFWLELTKSFQ